MFLTNTVVTNGVPKRVKGFFKAGKLQVEEFVFNVVTAHNIPGLTQKRGIGFLLY